MIPGTNKPFISVCIPAYKHGEYLSRLLSVLSKQTFTDFEVIITDDSPDNSVREIVSQFSKILPIKYFKNNPIQGTPENWNEAIRQAKGQWIKLIHDDDWLASDTSLEEYVEAIRSHPGIDFFYSSYRNVNVTTNVSKSVSKGVIINETTSLINEVVKKKPDNIFQHGAEIIKPGLFRIKQLKQNPVTLLSKNIIGPPSVIIHRNDHQIFYDKNLKWLVDMDFYMRYLVNHRAVYIDKPLVNIGLSEQQVTKFSSLVREVEIPEHFRILEKTGVQHLENLLVYDAWWRLIRNLEIRHQEEIRVAGYHGNIPRVLSKMISFQQKTPIVLLKFGPASKSMMMASYTYNKLTNGFRD